MGALVAGIAAGIFFTLYGVIEGNVGVIILGLFMLLFNGLALTIASKKGWFG